MSRQRFIYIESNYYLIELLPQNRKIAQNMVSSDLGGRRIGRSKKNKGLLTGRAGRKAIESEDIARESLRWQRRKQTVERYFRMNENSKN